MTLIVGMNLSDRLYIAGDTRVTFSNGLFKDDIIKVAPLCGEFAITDDQKGKQAICVAVAGSLALANFLYHSMRFAIKSGELPSDIRTLSAVVPDFLKKKMDEWLKTNSYQSCCIIFGGMCDDRRKKIELDDLNRLKEILKRNVAPQEELDEVKAKLENDPIFQELAKRIPRGRLMRPFEDPEAMVVNPLIEQAIEQGQDFIDAPDSLVFGVQIGRGGLSQEIAEWGEVLAYGTDGLSKSDLPEDFLAMMELSTGQLVNEKDLMESMHVREYILKIAKDRNIMEIGGSVTPMVVRDCLLNARFGYRHGSLDGRIHEMMYERDDKLVFFREGQPEIEMKWFTLYQAGSGQAEL